MIKLFYIIAFIVIFCPHSYAQEIEKREQEQIEPLERIKDKSTEQSQILLPEKTIPEPEVIPLEPKKIDVTPTEEKFFPKSENVAPESPLLQNRNTVTNVIESTVVEDKFAGKYQKTTVSNLAKLYWLRGVLDVDNDTAIDNFIQVQECEFYKDNFKDDFKWMQVRRAARKMIKQDLPTYSDKFKIVVPIKLGRYDTKRQGFPIVDDTSFMNLRRVEIAGNSGQICTETWDLELYPKTLYLLLSTPLTYDFMKLDEHLAQAYILRNNIYDDRGDAGYKDNTYNRLAYARVRMTFSEYQGDEKVRYKERVALIFGKIDGIDIFENADETGLLSSVEIED